MFKSFEEFQTLGKDSFEAYVASATAMTKGFQTMAQQAAEFSKSAFEKGSQAYEKASGAKSIDKALEVHQGYAKDSYEAMVAQMGKFTELYTAAAKEAFKPFEANFQAFGIKTSTK